MADKKTIATWALSILLTLAFLFFGGMKLTGNEMMEENLHGNLGVPLWAIPVIGAIEMAGALLIAVPKTRFWGAKVLAVTMVGAVITHFLASDFVGWALPATLGVLASIVAWIERPEWTEKWLPRKA